MFLSFVCLVRFLFHPRFSPSCQQAGTQGYSSNIRFPSTCRQYVVPSLYPGCQSSKACLVPATNDGRTCSCLLDIRRPSTIRFFSGYASLRCVHISSSLFRKSHDGTTVSSGAVLHGVGVAWFFRSFPN